jgi:hypothetical protein
MSDALRWAVSDIASDPRLERLLAGAYRHGENFSGLGLVFCETDEAVPHVPIYSEPAWRPSSDVCTLLVDRSSFSNARHDGFHLLKPNWDPLALGVFLAPPLPREPIENPGNHGCRWITASLISRLPGVIACLTILRVERHVTLFVEGRAELLLGSVVR